MPSTNLRVIRSISRGLSVGRIDGDASLGAAVGNVDHCGLPSHEGRQRADFVQVDLGMVAEAAFHRSAGVVVLHAIADERADLAVVHLDAICTDDFALGRQQQLPHVLAEIHAVGGPVEIQPGGVEGLVGRSCRSSRFSVATFDGGGLCQRHEVGLSTERVCLGRWRSG